ncbi:2-phosphosulfolactate phosphatase [Branchiibius sp. NY16-3462-2]|uniref:2-phosphosulfolactate phosphatase n=1 Tax=Branchiibius sp. NY16-3462-2 TaxID=1807500 RepID=UPI0007974C0D|nr:2-phosphosulfolactate phosphatase [Branchiibius sp. NY16-3462-2]KYH45157.1 hypothetical protein AZH51_14855 [Branchiibius sp. NY16-3462-2]
MQSRFVGFDQVPTHLSEPVVVIDVLRAFTTAAWVVESGASGLWSAPSTRDALATKTDLGPRAIAITDRDVSGGFDLGNSPALVRRHDLDGRPVVQTTTNGTVGVHAARHAPLILCAALVTATATARVLAASGAERITYVITGDNGHAEEDVACADLIQAILTSRGIPTDTVDRVQQSRAAHGLREAVTAGLPGVDAEDIELACEVDRFDFTLRAIDQNGLIQVQPVAAGQTDR